MAFLLNVDPRDDGTTRLEYDISPVERVQMLTLSNNALETLGVSPDALIGQSLTAVRPPARTRRHPADHGAGQ